MTRKIMLLSKDEPVISHAYNYIFMWLLPRSHINYKLTTRTRKVMLLSKDELVVSGTHGCYQVKISPVYQYLD